MYFCLKYIKSHNLVFALNFQMHQAVIYLYYNNFVWCETKFYLLQQNILMWKLVLTCCNNIIMMWNKLLLIATTLFWCETGFNYYNNTFRWNKVILGTILNWCNICNLLLQNFTYYNDIFWCEISGYLLHQ